MATFDLPYKTTFAAQIRAIEPSERELNETKASLTDLKQLLPAGIDPEENPQLLYIAANLYVAGMVNLNDDGVDVATSLAAYSGFEKQQLNIEHDRKRIAGYILHAGLSEFGTDRLITEDEARAAGKPFNVAVVAVLWKVANRELCAYLQEASNPMHPDYKTLSLSFEVGFSSYNIGIFDGDERDIAKAKRIVAPADADYQDLSKRLRVNGGSGRLTMDGTEHLYQVLSGTFLPLGGGIVTTPAAAVKGITAITEPSDKEEVTEDEDETEEATIAPDSPPESGWVLAKEFKDKLIAILARLEKNSLSCIKREESRVSLNRLQTITHPNMNLTELKEKLASATNKPEDLQQICAGAFEIAEAISAESEKRALQLAEEKSRGLEIEKSRAEAQAANDTLTKTVADLQKQLSEIKAAQDAAAAELKFDERMAEINEEFDLADDERALIIEEVKSLDDTAFAGWMTKAKKLMKEKSKSFKKDIADKQKDKNEKMCSALAAKGIKVTMDENDLIKEVIASAQANNVSSGIENVVEASNSQSLADRMKAEFEENMSIGGRKIKDIKKKE